MEKFVEQGYLYDFYGELLTERQQQVYESVDVYKRQSLMYLLWMNHHLTSMLLLFSI